MPSAEMSIQEQKIQSKPETFRERRDGGRGWRGGGGGGESTRTSSLESCRETYLQVSDPTATGRMNRSKHGDEVVGLLSPADTHQVIHVRGPEPFPTFHPRPKRRQPRALRSGPAEMTGPRRGGSQLPASPPRPGGWGAASAPRLLALHGTRHEHSSSSFFAEHRPREPWDPRGDPPCQARESAQGSSALGRGAANPGRRRGGRRG